MIKILLAEKTTTQEPLGFPWPGAMGMSALHVGWPDPGTR